MNLSKKKNLRSLIEAKRGWKSKVKRRPNFEILLEHHTWGLQKYQNHYEILFGRGCIDLENSAVLLLLAQGKSDTLSFFEDCNMTKYLTNIFLLWINVNRLCLHVGLEFWTLNSFMCPKLTIFTTWKFRFTTLYYVFHLI